MGSTDTSDAKDKNAPKRKPDAPLKRGWTTGACSTAATKSALTALLTGEHEDPVTITLPKGETPSFPLARETVNASHASASIIKDAGDDPDVTHGALISTEVRWNREGEGITFHAGKGVGIVTKQGLPIPPGEPAINPVPRSMMIAEVEKLCAQHDRAPDIAIPISVENGAELAQKTWNPRLGITGGLSILGTTGIVHPFSCSAWIHSIHRGIDVARAARLPHVLAATGSTSESAALNLYDLPEIALLDMGDFAGGVLKYLNNHPIPRITLAGGFAKFTKLAQGSMDLHSSRSQVDFDFLADRKALEGLSNDQLNEVRTANTAMEVLELVGPLRQALAEGIASTAQQIALSKVDESQTEVEVILVDRKGVVLAKTGFGSA